MKKKKRKKKSYNQIVKTYLIGTEMRFGGNLRSVSENKIKEILVLDDWIMDEILMHERALL